MSYLQKKREAVFKAQDLIPVITEARQHNGICWIVKDHGVYIMPDVGEQLETGRYKNIAYAVGCNPDVDEAWWENSREAIGGDDTGEQLDVSITFFDDIIDKTLDLHLKVTDEELTWSLIIPTS